MSIDILYVSSAERGGTVVWVMLLSVAAEAGKVRTLVVLMRHGEKPRQPYHPLCQCCLPRERKPPLRPKLSTVT